MPALAAALVALAAGGLGALVWVVTRARARGTVVAPPARQRGPVDGSRLLRLLRMGRLSARLSTSFVGAAVRRLLRVGRAPCRARPEGRELATGQAGRRRLGHMKGAFMKLGQIASFLNDGVPEGPRGAGALQRRAADGSRWCATSSSRAGHAARARCSPSSTGADRAASIGQVHRAHAADGQAVAVKVQYPGVDEAIAADLDNVDMLFGMIGAVLSRRSTPSRSSTSCAAASPRSSTTARGGEPARLRRLYAATRSSASRACIAEHSTARVLTSEFVRRRALRRGARSWTQADARRATARSSTASCSARSRATARSTAIRTPATTCSTPTARVMFLDFGCVKYFPPEMLADWQPLVPGAHGRR